MIFINNEKCTACGICGIVCPRHVLETVGQGTEKMTRICEQRKDLCLNCGQCTSVCQSDAIEVDVFSGHDFKSVQPLAISEEDLLMLMEQRRSTRRYKDKPVPRDSLNRILAACKRAPTGAANHSTGVVVIDTETQLKELSAMIYDVYQGLEKALKNPITRFFIKLRIGKQAFSTLGSFVMPGMHWYLKWKEQGLGDEILRDCKALMLFHSPVLEPMAQTNCALSAFHGIFMAEILGVGTCFNDLIPPACNQNKEILNFLGVPEGREVYSSLTLGYSKFKYQKVIPRKLAEARYLD